MKAVRIHRFGDPDVLQFEEIAVPSPKEGEVLVQVSGAGTNPVDYKIRAGKFPRITAKELPITLGRDICGTVQKSGADPDEVIALLNWDLGGYAQFAALPRTLCVPKPRNMTAVDAAAIPLAAMTAWQGLFDHAQLQPKEKILIHGGSGGVGTFAVQLARRHGAQIIATTSTKNISLVKQLGADEVIDYKTSRFQDLVHDVDVVFDTVGGKTRELSWSVLKPNGRMVTIVSDPPSDDPRVQKSFFIVEPIQRQLVEIGKLLDAGSLKTFVNAVLPLEDAAKAYRKPLPHELGYGKIVITIPNGGQTS